MSANATAIAARDRGATYPVAQTGDMQTESYVDSADTKPLNKGMIARFVDKLLAHPAHKSDPLRSDGVTHEFFGMAAVVKKSFRS